MDSDFKRLERMRPELFAMGYRELRVIEGKGICGIRDFMFTIAIVYGLDSVGFEGRYCYPRQYVNDLTYAYGIWDGKKDPMGRWVKHKGWREYTNPNSEEVEIE